MLLIVAHHYVVNSGLVGDDVKFLQEELNINNLFVSLFGAWGKVGINCFLMITGYFMCTSRITFRKLIKLLGQIYFYRLGTCLILVLAGYDTISISRIVKLAMPFWGLKNDFIGCFIAFYLTIPFWNILVRNMTKREHELLLLLMLGLYTLLGSIPTFDVTFNYVTWFGVIYLIASYIRLHPHALFEKKSFWGWATLLTVTLSMLSIIILLFLFVGKGMNIRYFFLTDSNKIFAVMVAVSSFLWFKNLTIKYNKIINAFGAGTFGVLLIHANSDAMRQWLWKDFIDVARYYETLETGSLILYSIGVVLAVFAVCNLIDQLRIATLEKWFLRWYDTKISAKAESLIQRIK